MSTASTYDAERPTDAADRPADAAAALRGAAAGPVVAIVSLLLALFATARCGLPLRDPDGVASGRLLVALALVAVLILADIAVRAARHSAGPLPSIAAMRTVRRARWDRRRLVTVALAVLSFFLTYFAYRNLKSVVPLLRPELFDAQLATLDRDLFGGHAPAVVLQDLLGRGLAAEGLSTVYVLLFAFIPASLALALVFSRDLRAGLFYSTAFSLNWLLAGGSYYLLPSIGPFHDSPGDFAQLPSTAVSALQSMLLDERSAFLRDPTVAGSAQSIGAFASLHVSVYVTAALAAGMLGLPVVLRRLLWVLTGLTVVSTVYFGWHYVADDAAGVVIGLFAVVLGRAAIGAPAAPVLRPWRVRAVPEAA
jgi:PAP2 superfamily